MVHCGAISYCLEKAQTNIPDLEKTLIRAFLIILKLKYTLYLESLLSLNLETLKTNADLQNVGICMGSIDFFGGGIGDGWKIKSLFPEK